MKAVGEFISKYAFILSAALLAAGVWPVSQMANIRVDNAIDVWLDHRGPEYREYIRFQQDYGNDEWILAAFSVAGISPSEVVADIGSVANDLLKIGDGVKVVSVANADPMTLQALGGLLMSPDRKTAGILLDLSDLGKIENRREIVRKVDAALAPHAAGREFHLGGPTLLNAELDRISEHQSRIFMTLAFVVTVICLFVVFRSAMCTGIVLTGAGPAVVLTLGTALGSGMTLNMITTVLPVLIWVLSLTGGIHLVHRFRKALAEGDCADRALIRCIEEVFQPCAVAAATTAVGFLSLLFSHMGPVRDLGVWAAGGIGIGFVCDMTFIPAVLKLSSRLPSAAKRLERKPFKTGLRPSAIRERKWPIVVTGFLVFAASMFLVPSLKVESNVLTFFRKDSRILRDYEFISGNLTGLSTMELDFQGPFPDTLFYIGKLSEKLEGVPDLRPVVYTDGGAFRMSIFVKTMESMGFNALVEKVRNAMAQIESERVKARLTGTVLLLNSIQEELVRTQLKSFGMALATIVVIFILVFRSPAVVIVGAAVNVFPISVLAAAAALWGVPLNVATVMIAAVAIGIAVDDTVYFLSRLRAETGRQPNADRAVDAALSHMAGPVTATTLVVSAGFFALVPAEFTPIRYFGILGGLTMISAWVGDVVLLPALLYAFHPRTGENPRESKSIQ